MEDNRWQAFELSNALTGAQPALLQLELLMDPLAPRFYLLRRLPSPLLI